MLCLPGAFKRIPWHTLQQLGFIMASFTFKASLQEVAQEYLHNAFLLAQRPLTDAVTAIFKKTFGALEWSSNLKTYVGPSMKDFVFDDGRAFDMCVRSLHCSNASLPLLRTSRFACRAKALHGFRHEGASWIST